MEETAPIVGCPGCAALSRDLAALKAVVARLEAELAAAKKNSSNSSKPPSSDIVKPPNNEKQKAARKGRKCKRGGQKGHPKHERAAFEPSKIDSTIEYTMTSCPQCGGKVTPAKVAPKIVQQVEVIEQPIEITEHRGMPYWCRRCKKIHYAPIDEQVRWAGLVGPRLTGLIAYLKGACHCSYSTIRKFIRDVIGVTISRGQLAKLIDKVSVTLEISHEQLEQALRDQTVVNVDETGHKDNGRPMWTWCFRAPEFTYFTIAETRSSEVLIDVLGEEFAGVLGCDYFSAYRKYMGEFNVLVQFCLAHLIRDIKFLCEHPDKRNRAYGKRVLTYVRELFAVFHRRERMAPGRFAVELQDAGDELLAQAEWRVPNTREANNLAKRFECHGESYIRFITTPGVEPTNNLAEQAIRFVVLDRKVTQGTRGETGQRWLERIWTVIATCSQQGRSVFQFLIDTIRAHLTDKSYPSLIPNTS